MIERSWSDLRRWMLAVLMAVCACSLNAQPPAGPHEILYQQVSEVLYQQAVEQFPDATVTVSVAELDSRIALADCERPSVTPRGQRRLGRVPVAVSCIQPAWTVFLTGTIEVQQPVVVAARTLPRGSVLNGSALTIEQRNLADLRQSHFAKPADLNGLELKRPLSAGAVVYANMVKVPIAIRRGDRVVIVANRGSVNISVPGESLENGMPGEQIRVRNNQSKKVVHAWVRGTGVVTTAPTEAGG